MFRNYRVEGKYRTLMRENVNGLFNREELKLLVVPMPPISVQKEITIQLDKEKEYVDASKKFIEIYEQKIKDKIAEVWEE